MNINELLKNMPKQQLAKKRCSTDYYHRYLQQQTKNQKKILTNVTHPSHWTKIHSINSNQTKNHYAFPSDMAQFYLKSNVRDAIR